MIAKKKPRKAPSPRKAPRKVTAPPPSVPGLPGIHYALLEDGDEVEWIWRHTPEGSYVSGFEIFKPGQSAGRARGSRQMTVQAAPNVEQAVPFFRVASMEASVRFYVDGLGFEMTKKWIDKGVLRWCWLQHGGAALMLQEYLKEGHGAFTPQGKLGAGVSVCFICKDALAIYRDACARGLKPERPFVGNAMWVVGFHDPDGYRIEFESPTDAPEESVYQDGAG
ncbi:MAG: VOC family protein [Planctomycetota bacterium]|nr:VOC family protein [Planctomycetota bacterium]